MSQAAAPAAAASPSAPAPPPHTQISLLRVAPAVFLLVAFLPLWIIYGLVGALLTTPSAVISRRCFALLVLLAAGVVAELAYSRDTLNTPWSSLSSLPAVMVVVVGLGALLYAQWRVHRLVAAVIDHPRGSKTFSNLPGVVTALCVAYAMWVVGSKSEFMDLTNGVCLPAFVVAYLAVPVIIALTHARLWIPARYSELERVERELVALNVSCKFEQRVVAGLGTIFVPCRSKSQGASERKTLVLIHGYAAGNAPWACNFEYLAQHYDLYAVEWMGIGRSDRPIFKSYDYEYADEIFVDSIEKWRKELKLDKFYLAGHSMGAMFSSTYAVKYPGHVEHLVLLSPAGVGQPPSMDSLSLSSRIFHFVWNLKYTPMSLIRFAGPLGPVFTRYGMSARLSVAPEMSAMRRGLLPSRLLADYYYHNWALEASGDIAMHTHLHPGVHGKKPICEILTPKTIHVPITFLYGGGLDWMDNRHGHAVAKEFEGHQRVRVLLVPHASHQVNTDNVHAFNTMLHQILQDTV